MKHTLPFVIALFFVATPALSAPATMKPEGTNAPIAAFTPKPKADDGTGTTPAAPKPATAAVAPKKDLPDTAAPVAAAPKKDTEKPTLKPLPLKDAALGDMQIYRAAHEDTLVTIAQKFNVGYVELRAANPGVDAWLPGRGTKIVIPTRHLLPDGPRNGILVNLGEMRLYSFVNGKAAPITYPIGIGREGFSSPIGQTTITHKAKDPIWRPTPRMLKEVPDLDPVYGPGPDNPLGDRAMYLGWPTYLIHGTNKPWGVGRRVSSGCMRMYPDDIRTLFDVTPVGTKVTVIRQPAKVGWIGDMLYVEISPEGAQADFVENKGDRPPYSVPADLFARLKKAAGKRAADIDWEAVRKAAQDRYGFPVPVLKGWEADDYMKVAGMTRPAQVQLSQQDVDTAVDRYTAAQRDMAEHDRGEELDAAKPRALSLKEPKTHLPSGGYNR